MSQAMSWTEVPLLMSHLQTMTQQLLFTFLTKMAAETFEFIKLNWGKEFQTRKQIARHLAEWSPGDWAYIAAKIGTTERPTPAEVNEIIRMVVERVHAP